VANSDKRSFKTAGFVLLAVLALASIGYVALGGSDSDKPVVAFRKTAQTIPTGQLPPPLPPPSVVAIAPEDAAVQEDAGGCPSGQVMIDEVYRGGERGRGCAIRLDAGKRLEEGVWTITNSATGQYMSGPYKDGLRQGTWTAFYPSGNTFQKIDFIDDKKNGVWVQWKDDGTRVFEKEYRDDKQDGRTLIYLADGGVEEERWQGGVQQSRR
jgi:hypothetical protein